MSSWKTVPDFFPEPHELSADDWYRLREGYGVGSYETRRSGKHYKRVRVDGDFCNLLAYLGFAEWWKYWRLRRFLWIRYWVRR